MKSKLDNTLGMAFISKNLFVGQDNINKLNFNKLKVVLYDEEISEKYINFLMKVNSERKIKYYKLNRDVIANAIGIKNAKVCAITQKSFAKKIIEQLGD